ncbi:MAG: antitoxin [Candidatus Marinimicrobia bacterium]|nr:antitoxin [Candidatus Neomarinimicrobiota bacterium]
MTKLDKYEQEILRSYENDEWESVPDLEKRKLELQEYARETLRKDKRVNIRITGRDLRQLQRIALREGLPYQTLISSILHKYVNGVPIQ